MLITVSGIDGSGKSTQIGLIREFYEKQGLETIYFWSRGGYTDGIERLKKLLRTMSASSLPSSGNSKERDAIIKRRSVQYLWLVAAILDLIWIYGIKIRWWSSKGAVVICDRYLLDTIIDFRINFPKMRVKNFFLFKILKCISKRPDVELMLLIPEQLSESRCLNKFDPFPDPSNIRHARYVMYKSLSKSKPIVIDASKVEVEVFSDIKSYLEANG